MVSPGLEDDDDSNASSATTENISGELNGGTTDGRSVFNAVYGRSRLTTASVLSVNGESSTTVEKHHRSQPTAGNSTSSTSSQHRHDSSRRNERERTSSTPSSTSTARESFLNYFFGQNGPGPAAGADITEAHGHLNRAGGAIGRGVSGSVGDAAYDMKSLGNHIEAVSHRTYPLADHGCCRSFGFPMVSPPPLLPSICYHVLNFALIVANALPLPHLHQTSVYGGSQLSPKEEMEINLIRSFISSYFDIVRQTTQDLVPKAIMHLLVNHTSQHVQDRLVSTLYKPELFSELLHEDESLVSERARVKALLDAYKDAFNTLSEVSLKSS